MIGRFFLLIAVFSGLTAAIVHAEEPSARPNTETNVRQPDPPADGDAIVRLDLETALRWTLQSNPALVATRHNLDVSAAALAVARQFPTSLNPTVSIDVRPFVYGSDMPGEANHWMPTFVSANWMQPIELGSRTRIRTRIALAAYRQTSWNILQTELNAMVQTYRLHQTAIYRRERLAIAQRLLSLNEQLLNVLRHAQDANQVSAADVVLAEVESETTNQTMEVAQQEYVAALSDLRQQIGLPQYAATIIPEGPLVEARSALPATEEEMQRMAMESRPEIRAAENVANGSQWSLKLAQADRIPVPSVGPVFEHNEQGVAFYGIAASSTIPILNSGATLVRQREEEYRRDCVALEQERAQVATQVRAVYARWGEVQAAVSRTHARFEPIHTQSERMERLFQAGQTDVLKLLQVRQRSIEAENAVLDMDWQTTQVYADLVTALGATPLLGALPAEQSEP